MLVAWTESITSPYELWFQVLGGGSTAYGYDGYDRLTDVSIGGSVVRSYAYDADGRRVRSYDGASGNMRYVYSGLNVLYEVPDGGGDATIRFYVGGLAGGGEDGWRDHVSPPRSLGIDEACDGCGW